MELHTAIRLIRRGISPTPAQQVWADLGAGHGLFTRALSTVLRGGSTIFAVDKDTDALDAIVLSAVNISLKKIASDFSSNSFELPVCDGLLMCNSLHYVRNQKMMLQRMATWLSAYGRLIVVEYDSDIPNTWVPYPMSYATLTIHASAYFPAISKLSETPSAFGRANIYAALLTGV